MKVKLITTEAMKRARKMRIKGCDCKVTVWEEGRILTSVYDSWDSLNEAINNVCSRKNIRHPHLCGFQIVNLTEGQIAHYRISKNSKIRKIS